MRNNQKLIGLCLIFVLFTFSNFVVRGRDIKITSNLDGEWISENEGEIYISQNDNFLEIKGRDKTSIYSMTCLVENDAAECVGSGVCPSGKFIYKSTLKIRSEKEQIIIEEFWNAKFSGAQKLNGRTVFRRAKKKENIKDLKIGRG